MLFYINKYYIQINLLYAGGLLFSKVLEAYLIRYGSWLFDAQHDHFTSIYRVNTM